MPLLSNFSDLKKKKKKLTIFVTFKGDSQVDFQSNLKKKLRESKVDKL